MNSTGEVAGEVAGEVVGEVAVEVIKPLLAGRNAMSHRQQRADDGEEIVSALSIQLIGSRQTALFDLDGSLIHAGKWFPS